MSPELIEYLSNPIYKRESPDEVDAALHRLGVSPGAAFREFFYKYNGPFGSIHNGWELLDIVRDTPSIESQTKALRRAVNFPNQLFAMTLLQTNAVMSLDCESGRIYHINFEGGVNGGLNCYLAGKLTPHWLNFETFLEQYFLGDD